MEAMEQNLKKKKKIKKSKKEKEKEKEKTDQQADDNLKQNSVTRSERAISYLNLWNSDKKSWKFNKMHQIQLLHIMYDDAVLQEDDFQTLLLYLSGMKGKAKEKTHEQALKYVNGKQDEGEEFSQFKEQRAREIVQALS